MKLLKSIKDGVRSKIGKTLKAKTDFGKRLIKKGGLDVAKNIGSKVVSAVGDIGKVLSFIKDTADNLRLVKAATVGAIAYIKDHPKTLRTAPLAPLIPLVYGASHAFRDPIDGMKVIGAAIEKGTFAGMKKNVGFTASSIKADLQKLANYKPKSKTIAIPQNKGNPASFISGNFKVNGVPITIR